MVDLKSILPKQDKKRRKENYWSLSIEPGWVQVAIWIIEEEKAKVIASSAPTSWEKDEELVEASDAALSSAVQAAPEDISDPSKTVFAVPSSWVSQGQIKEEYLGKIKKLCAELSLKPVGFVVLSEAIAHFMKSEEASPLSAIVLGVSKDYIEVSYFKLGTLVGFTEVARSVSVADDVFEGLNRIGKGETLPSRFLLYNGRKGELEEVKQTLVKVDWSDFTGIDFLHAPKIETISPTDKINAVCLAGASELADVTVVESAEEARFETPEKEVENVISAKDEVGVEDIGFVLGEDVLEKSPPEKEEDQGVGKKSQASTESFEKEVFQEKEKKFDLPSIPLAGFLQKVKEVFGKIPFPRFKNTPFVKKPLIIGAVFLIILLIGGFLAWWYLPKATVTVYVSTKRLDERVSVTIDPDLQGANSQEGVLGGKVLTETLAGEKTTSTTGTKTVGEKASGEVTIYRVGPKLTLSTGTVVHGPDNLDFTLDETTSVASGSAATPGTTKAKVTAEDIGAQYNLAGGTVFTISNYSSSDMEAKNDESFSGGTSREINAVSEDDQKRLLDELTDELETKANKNLSSDLGNDEFFIEESLNSSATDESYSNKVGDEAESLKLTLTLDAQAIVVSKSSLSEVAMKALESKVPEGFVLREDQVEYNFKYDGSEDGIYKMDVKISANLLPEIDPDEIAQRIVGRYPVLADKYLNTEVPGFVRAEIRLKPKLPGRLGTLPRIRKNIDVEISSER